MRAVVFHYNPRIRERVVDAFRHAGFVTYDATDPQHAYRAVWTYRPHVVITDFPALLEDSADERRTLTEAIRRAPALRDVAIINLAEHQNADEAMLATQAGVTATLDASIPEAQLINKVHEVSRHSGTGST